MITEPCVEVRSERKYFGMRFVAPYRGMFSRVAEEFKGLDRWVKGNASAEYGSRFLRYLVIDMRGDMELEVGVFGNWGVPLKGSVYSGVLPGGRYAALRYRGLGLAANKALLDWIDEKGFRSDRKEAAMGDAFACRYEAYLTDPKVEPRKKQWEIELAIKLR